MPWSYELGAEVQLHSFLTSALDGDKRSTSCPSHFTSGKERWYPLNRRLGGTQSQSGLLEKRKISCPYWDSNQWSSSPQLVATPTVLLWLLQVTLNYKYISNTSDCGILVLVNHSRQMKILTVIKQIRRKTH
jgi:hypothetical protein